MTARARLLRLRSELAIAAIARALLIAAAAILTLLTGTRWLAVPWGDGAASLVGTAMAAMMLARLFSIRSLIRVALWVEERHPSLQYALVSVADGASSPALDAQAQQVDWWRDAQRDLLHSLVMPAIGSIAALAIAMWSPVGVRTTPRGDGDAASVSRRGGVGDPLHVVHASVTSPAYAGRASTESTDPTNIEALVGSSITLSGQGDARLLIATADSTARSVASRGNGWSLSLAMPGRPAIVRLQTASGRTRLIVLAPVFDAAPSVTLVLPAHDTIVRAATGVLLLRAELRDDIGIRDGMFELVVSAGSGENFVFRASTTALTVFGSGLERTLVARLRLESLGLKPGDMLQLRAVARDGNTVSGPGVGSSDTRALRVARADEYDSVAVDAAPPPEAEAQTLSQRMLINVTEALVRRRPALARALLVDESRKIASEQRKLRKRVGDIVFQRLGNDPLSEEGADAAGRGKLTPEALLKLADSATTGASGGVMDVEGDETPILSINKPLLEAFNAMWDAGRALEVGEPARALPPMREALAAIERARQAERIYLRGKPGRQIVDVAAVRLAGKDKGVSSIREPRLSPDPVARRRRGTFERVTAMLARDPDAAADSLLIMRVDALGDAPVLAAALDGAARALRARDATALPMTWTRVRRALGGLPAHRVGVSPWQGAP